MSRAKKEIARYEEFCAAAAADPSLQRFAPPVLDSLRVHQSGWMINGDPGDIIYEIVHDGSIPRSRIAVEYTSAAAAEKLQELTMAAFERPSLPQEFGTPRLIQLPESNDQK